jgi:hypothetical protein
MEHMRLKTYTLAKFLPEKQKFRLIATVTAYSLHEAYKSMAKGLGYEEFDSHMNDPNVKFYYEISLDAYVDFKRTWLNVN